MKVKKRVAENVHLKWDKGFSVTWIMTAQLVRRKERTIGEKEPLDYKEHMDNSKMLTGKHLSTKEMMLW